GVALGAGMGCRCGGALLLSDGGERCGRDGHGLARARRDTLLRAGLSVAGREYVAHLAYEHARRPGHDDHGKPALDERRLAAAPVVHLGTARQRGHAMRHDLTTSLGARMRVSCSDQALRASLRRMSYPPRVRTPWTPQPRR